MSPQTAVVTRWSLLRAWRAERGSFEMSGPAVAGCLLELVGSIEAALRVLYLQRDNPKLAAATIGCYGDPPVPRPWLIRLLEQAAKPEVTEAYLVEVGLAWRARQDTESGTPDPDELAGDAIVEANSVNAASILLVQRIGQPNDPQVLAALNLLMPIMTGVNAAP